MITKLLHFTKSRRINQDPIGRQKPHCNLNGKSLLYKELFTVTSDWHIEGLAGKE